MSGTDSEVFNTRERARSSDLNDLQSIHDRTLLDMLRAMMGSRTFALGALPSGAPRNVCIGGLTLSAVGNDVAIAPGVMVQESATLAPVPGTLDSDYRMAQLRSVELQTPPSPGGDTWYLLEMQMTEVVALNEFRDVWNTTLQIFQSIAVDKQTVRVPAFQYIAGTSTSLPAPSGGEWVPLGGVFRAGGGGAVSTADIVDLRQMWDSLYPNRDRYQGPVLANRSSRLIKTVSVPQTASDLVFVHAEAFTDPQRLWYSRSGALDVTAASVIEPGTTIAADTWFYLYLAPWEGLGPVSVLDATATGRGVLVLSENGPLQIEERNAVTLDLPAPYANGGGVAVGGAVCVGALLRNAANTGWVASAQVGADQFSIEPQIVTNVSLGATPGATTTDLSSIVPRTAKRALVRLRTASLGAAATNGNYSYKVQPVGVTAGRGYLQTEQNERAALDVTCWIDLIDSLSFDGLFEPIPGPAFQNSAPDYLAELIGWAE